MNLRNLDLNLLVVFDALYEERNVTAAAERLDLSQPAMSNALARLRRLMGDTLFVRTSEGMFPTPRAQELAGPVRQALANIQSAIQQERAFVPARAQRTFTIAATDYAEFVLLPKLMEHLASVAPHIDLDVVSVGAEIPKTELESGRVDLALGRFREIPRGIQAARLFEERFVCVVRVPHPVVRQHLSLKQFTTLSHVLVSARGAGPGVVDEALVQHGLQRRVALWVPHFLVIPIVVAQSDLIATLSERVARFFAPFLSLRVLTPPVQLSSYPVVQVWHERVQQDPAHHWLRELLLSISKQV